jgi:hypothetical protein
MKLKNIAKRIPFRHKTKLVEVLVAPQVHPDAKIGKCWSVARQACDDVPGTTMVQGYMIQPCDQYSLRPSADAVIIKHYWNKTRGQFIDYSPVIYRDCVYVLDQHNPVNHNFSDWLEQDSIQYYTLGGELSGPTVEEQVRLEEHKAWGIAQGIR